MRVTACSNRMNSSHFCVRDGPLEKLWGFPCANIFFVLRPPPHPYLHKFSNGPSLKVHLLSLGSLSNDDGDGNEDGKKAIGLISKTTTLHVHHAFCTFLCRRCCTTTTRKCLISRSVEEANTRQRLSFSFPELWYSLQNSTTKKFAKILRIKRDGISAIKFKAACIPFLSDVFVTVAVVVAYSPYSQFVMFH